MEVHSVPCQGTTIAVELPDPITSSPMDSAVPHNSKGSNNTPVQAMNLNPIRILVADDHNIVRKGIATMLNAELDFEVVGEAGDGKETLDLVHQLSPDLVVLDIDMPKMSGLEVTQVIQKEMPQTKAIGLSMILDPHMIDSMKQAGAVAYLSKEGRTEELIKAIRECCVK